MALFSFGSPLGGSSTRYHYYNASDADAKEWCKKDSATDITPSLLLSNVNDINASFKNEVGDIKDLTIYSSDGKFTPIDYKLIGKLNEQLGRGAKVQFNVRMEDLDDLEDACVFGGLEKFTWLRKLSKEHNGKKMWYGELLAQTPNFELNHVSAAGGSSSSTSAATAVKQVIGDDDIELAPLPTEKAPGKESCADKPKACANCSCGRSQLEDEHGAEKAKEMLETGQVRSACGNCSLGDAFRCASCPYKGTPAFQPGDKVELKNQENDASGNRSEGAAVVAKGGKVQLGADTVDLN